MKITIIMVNFDVEQGKSYSDGVHGEGQLIMTVTVSFVKHGGSHTIYGMVLTFSYNFFYSAQIIYSISKRTAINFTLHTAIIVSMKGRNWQYFLN